jgi:hypothetical protein
MKRWMLGIAMAALAGALGAEARSAEAATAAAQVETKTETKVKAKGGKDVHLTGCVEPASGPASFMLTDVVTSEKTPDIVHNYYLIGKTDDLEKNIGHVMEIDGIALDRGKGELEVETKTKIEREHAPDSKEKTKTEIKGENALLPFLDVTAAKMVRPTCS